MLHFTWIKHLKAIFVYNVNILFGSKQPLKITHHTYIHVKLFMNPDAKIMRLKMINYCKVVVADVSKCSTTRGRTSL